MLTKKKERERVKFLSDLQGHLGMSCVLRTRSNFPAANQGTKLSLSTARRQYNQGYGEIASPPA